MLIFNLKYTDDVIAEAKLKNFFLHSLKENKYDSGNLIEWNFGEFKHYCDFKRIKGAKCPAMEKFVASVWNVYILDVQFSRSRAKESGKNKIYNSRI